MLRRSRNLLPRLASLTQGQSTVAAQNILDISAPSQGERRHSSGVGSPLNSIFRGSGCIIEACKLNSSRSRDLQMKGPSVLWYAEYSTQIATTSSGLPPTVHAAKNPSPAIQYVSVTLRSFEAIQSPTLSCYLHDRCLKVFSFFLEIARHQLHPALRRCQGLLALSLS
jgi:hypothetical protein